MRIHYNTVVRLTTQKISKFHINGPLSNPPVTSGSPQKGPVMRTAFSNCDGTCNNYALIISYIPHLARHCTTRSVTILECDVFGPPVINAVGVDWGDMFPAIQLALLAVGIFGERTEDFNIGKQSYLVCTIIFLMHNNLTSFATDCGSIIPYDVMHILVIINAVTDLVRTTP